MPVMDGMRAARAITVALPGIPIILHTLHWSPRVEIEALKAGARKVVAKTDSATIIAAVRELIAPEPLGYTATIVEASAPNASSTDITVIRPAPISLPAAKKRTKAAAQRRSDESGPADR